MCQFLSQYHMPCDTVWNQKTWWLQLCSSLPRLLLLFWVFCHSIQIWRLFLLLWKMLLEFYLGLIWFCWLLWVLMDILTIFFQSMIISRLSDFFAQYASFPLPWLNIFLGFLFFFCITVNTYIFLISFSDSSLWVSRSAIDLFICLSGFGVLGLCCCPGFSLFSSCREWDLFSSCSAQASHCGASLVAEQRQ